MEFIGKNVALNLATDEGQKLLKQEGINMEDLRFVPFVGFTLPEVGWHLKDENKFFGLFKNPKTAYWVAYWMGELACYNPFIDQRKGIFHKVLVLKKGERIIEDIHLSHLGV